MLLLDVGIAFLLDLFLGDPYWAPHPVRFIGWLIRKTEKILRKIVPSTIYDKNKTARQELLSGTALTILVVTITAFLVWIILYGASLVSPIAFHVLNIYFIYTSLATKCLADEAEKVWKELFDGNLPQARVQLAMLVGRQTEHLKEEEIIRGVVETTSENTVDGIISPLLFALVGSVFGIGAPMAYVFKAASTLDSMVGYMNEQYLYFGRASAKFDDALNYIPARFSGIVIPIAAFLCGLDGRQSFQIMIRDRRNHKSPNCAYPESAVAGALGIRIGGNNIYFGKVVEKPTIGDNNKPLEALDIKKTIKLMYFTAWIAFVIVFVLAYTINLALTYF